VSKTGFREKLQDLRLSGRKTVSAVPYWFRHQRAFDEVATYCSFVGYGSSGHSLLGSLLNAHPEIVISHELDVFALLKRRYPRWLIFSMIMQRDDEFKARNREWNRYDYNVSSQSQGQYSRLRVIGDKKGGRTTRWLTTNPELLGRLRRTIELPLRFIHQVRNPFDNIATKARQRKQMTVESAVDHEIQVYAGLCRTMDRVRQELDPAELFELRHEEDLVACSARTLAAACEFLGVEPFPEYLADCAKVVFPAPKRSRDDVTWTAAQRDQVGDLISRYSFLSGYTFDDAIARPA